MAIQHSELADLWGGDSAGPRLLSFGNRRGRKPKNLTDILATPNGGLDLRGGIKSQHVGQSCLELFSKVLSALSGLRILVAELLLEPGPADLVSIAVVDAVKKPGTFPRKLDRILQVASDLDNFQRQRPFLLLHGFRLFPLQFLDDCLQQPCVTGNAYTSFGQDSLDPCMAVGRYSEQNFCGLGRLCRPWGVVFLSLHTLVNESLRAEVEVSWFLSYPWLGSWRSANGHLATSASSISFTYVLDTCGVSKTYV